MKAADPVLAHLKRYERQYEEHANMWKAVGEEEYQDWKVSDTNQHSHVIIHFETIQESQKRAVGEEEYQDWKVSDTNQHSHVIIHFETILSMFGSGLGC
eukprot:7760526-Pyramimonas_sp.AAC.1